MQNISLMFLTKMKTNWNCYLPQMCKSVDPQQGHISGLGQHTTHQIMVEKGHYYALRGFPCPVVCYIGSKTLLRGNKYNYEHVNEHYRPPLKQIYSVMLLYNKCHYWT